MAMALILDLYFLLRVKVLIELLLVESSTEDQGSGRGFQCFVVLEAACQGSGIFEDPNPSGARVLVIPDRIGPYILIPVG